MSFLWKRVEDLSLVLIATFFWTQVEQWPSEFSIVESAKLVQNNPLVLVCMSLLVILSRIQLILNRYLELDFFSMREQIELQQAIAAALARDEEDESDESKLEDEIAFQDAIENLNLWLERERLNYRRLG